MTTAWSILGLLSFGIQCALATTWNPRPRFGIYDEQLQARGLIGTHFGTIGINASFDYVIVGGGTAGLTLARRLSDQYTVAVIEAGGFYEVENSNHTTIPANAAWYLGKNPAIHNPLNDWQQKTTPQPGFNNKTTYHPFGRTLGGSSTRNFMWYQRGTIGTYLKWANAIGDHSYAYDKFSKFFKKSVRFGKPDLRFRDRETMPQYLESDWSRTGGPLQVSYPRWTNPAARWLAKGLTAIGIKEVPGLQNGNLLGWTYIAHTLEADTQIRSTSETSFLREALASNNNLITYTSSLAQRVVFDEQKRASGVIVETAGIGSGNVIYQLNATREVIISAGAFRSPQLLMTSGIGPRDTLNKFNIPIVAERPGVGQNLDDHVWFGPSYATNVVTHGWLGDPAFSAAASKEYNEKRTGIMTNVGADLLAFERLPAGYISQKTRNDLDKEFGLDWPDIEIFTLDAYTGTLDDYLLGAPRNDNFTSVCIVVVAPFSKGNVSIASADTKIHPIVNPMWLTDPRDAEVAVAGFKRARAIFEAPVVKPLLKGEEELPGKSVQTDAQILQWIRGHSDTLHHMAGTAKMGLKNDSMAVLDSRARVYGVQNLRVVDASAFPVLPPGHIQATVYALAEKIADDILCPPS